MIFIFCLDFAYNLRRKSATSTCTQAGIYPDVLDCSLFHYCHQNQQHEILQCPNGLHFDPKLFMCSARQLVRCFSLYSFKSNISLQVDCQYEPPVTDEQSDSTSMEESSTLQFPSKSQTVSLLLLFFLLDSICRDYAPDTHLPVGNTIDEYIICGENGQSTKKKCKSGFHYNALTTNCEMSIYKMFVDFLLIIFF